MNEHSFVRSIHNALHPDVYKWKIHDTYTGGVPDAMYAGPAGTLFVEYKYIKNLPKKDTTVIRHSLSALQEAWLERMKQSTSVALVVGISNSAIIIVDDFSANICKSMYVEQSIPRRQVAQWIYDVTFSGRANAKRSPPKRKEPASHLEQEKK
jgi:hypothetical protein